MFFFIKTYKNLSEIIKNSHHQHRECYATTGNHRSMFPHVFCCDLQTSIHVNCLWIWIVFARFLLSSVRFLTTTLRNASVQLPVAVGVDTATLFWFFFKEIKEKLIKKNLPSIVLVSNPTIALLVVDFHRIWVRNAFPMYDHAWSKILIDSKKSFTCRIVCVTFSLKT